MDFMVSFINKVKGLPSKPTISIFSGIIGNNILNASLSHTASLILLVTSPNIELGITTDIGEIIILFESFELPDVFDKTESFDDPELF